MTDIRELSGKKKVKKRLGAWERYLVCRQMRFVFLLGNSTFDPMQQSEAAALWTHFLGCMSSKTTSFHKSLQAYASLSESLCDGNMTNIQGVSTRYVTL